MRAIELFAGAGGLGIGVSQAGFIPTEVVEWDRWCCDTIRENRADGVDALKAWPLPIERDVRGVDFRKHEGKIDLVTGGPPCQPFSLGGRHRGHADVRDMWPEAVRVVREVKPKAFVFENVKGLKRASFATYLAYIIHQLSYPEIVRREGEDWSLHLARLERHHSAKSEASPGLAYNVLFRVLNAADFGVPQRRERIVFVGFRTDLGVEWSFPNPTHSIDALIWDQVHTIDYWERNSVHRSERVIAPRLYDKAKRLKQRPTLEPWKTVREAIADLPDPQNEARASEKYHNHRFQPGARSYKGHTGSPMDEPAKTLKAGVHGVPGGENMLARADGTVRYFTVRESARIQTFPDNYRFHGSWTETMRQLGNAVPVELARTISVDIATRLRGLSA